MKNAKALAAELNAKLDALWARPEGPPAWALPPVQQKYPLAKAVK
jgi:hypothetical protein